MVDRVFDWFRVVVCLSGEVDKVVCLDFSYVCVWVWQVVVVFVYWYQFDCNVVQVEWCWCFVVDDVEWQDCKV